MSVALSSPSPFVQSRTQTLECTATIQAGKAFWGRLSRQTRSSVSMVIYGISMVFYYQD